MEIPTGMLLDRFGPRRVVTGLFVFTVAGTALFALASNGEVMLAARVMMGIGCVAGFSGAFMLIGRFYPVGRLTSIGGTLNSFAMLGTFLATAPLALAVTYAGWRASFAAIAVAALALALLAGWSLRDKPADAGEEIAAGAREDWFTVLNGLLDVIRTRGMFGIACAGIPLSAGSTLLGIWGGPYLDDVFALDKVGRGAVLMFMAFGGVAGHYLFG